MSQKQLLNSMVYRGICIYRLTKTTQIFNTTTSLTTSNPLFLPAARFSFPFLQGHFTLSLFNFTLLLCTYIFLTCASLYTCKTRKYMTRKNCYVMPISCVQCLFKVLNEHVHSVFLKSSMNTYTSFRILKIFLVFRYINNLDK